jgi:dTDP-glucose 4,6-dehydratase
MLDSIKLRTELGWQDKISLEEGIADTIRWMQTFQSDLSTLPSKYEHKA